MFAPLVAAMAARTHPRRLVALLGLALLVASSACGGGGSGDGAGDEGAKAKAGPTAGGFGGTLSGGATFAVLLVVFEQGSGTVDRVFVSCGSGGTIEQTVGVAKHVVIDGDGGFAGQSADVAVTGKFTSRTAATGTIQARSEAARGCGVPEDSTWQAPCAYRVKTTPRKTGETETGGIVMSLSVVTGEGGHKIVYLADEATTKEPGFSIEPGVCGTSTG